MTPNHIALAVAVPLVGWRLYSRIRRTIGRQTSKLWRHWCGATLFPLLFVVLAVFSTAAPWTLETLIASAVAGIALGRYGLSLTKFEKTADAAYFTPNPYLGSALVALFAMRMGYRFFQLYTMDSAPTPGDPTGGLGRSPLTLAVLGLLIGYYTTYAIGLIRWRKAGDAAAPVEV